MEICVESFDGEKYTVEVGVDDTTADIRRKVASAAELCEDGFDMSFGGKLLAAGDYITQLKCWGHSCADEDEVAEGRRHCSSS